jgi:hypothetical protein
MNSYRQCHDNVLWCGLVHWHPEIFDNPEAIQQKIAHDLADSGITQQQFDSSRLLLSFINEGHSASQLEVLCKYFDQTHGRSRYLVLASPYVDTTEYPIVGHTKSMVNHGDFLRNIQKHPPSREVVLDKKFLCLIRRASPSRAAFASQLRQSIDAANIRMSFGSHHHTGELREFQPLFPNDNLPMLLDGIILGNNRDKIYDVENLWYQSLFNIVVESSSQTDPDIWTSTFITEKTFKAFAMCQIPVWFAVPGLVQQVRALGFDMFDDIVDHSYDSIQDQNLRTQTVINTVSSLNKQYAINDCQQLRFAFWYRLQANYNLLDTIKQSYENELQDTMNKFINNEN